MKRKRAGRPYGGRSADLALQHESWSHILTKRQKKTVREVVSMRSIIGAGAIWLALCAAAPAQDYPTRTIRVIIPLGAGGGGDVFTRALADELQKALRQPVVVENRTGGALNIGARACAEAAPDGYTICVLSSEPVVYNQFVFKSLPFDPEKDFEPISNLFFNTLHSKCRR